MPKGYLRGFISGASRGIGQGAEMWAKEHMEAQKQQREEKETETYANILNDENSTSVQKANALAQLSRLNPNAAKSFLEYNKQRTKQTNLKALQENLQNQLNPQGVTSGQNATRNATNQFMGDGGGINPMLAASANMGQGGGQNQPQPMNAPQPIDPAQELEQQEAAYRNAASQASQLGEEGIARNYLSQADALQRKNIAQQKRQDQQQQFQSKKEETREKQILPIQESAMQTVEKTNTQLNALNSQMQAVQAGSVSPFSKGNLAKLLRATGHDVLASAAESEGSAIFKTAGKEVIAGGLKDAFGGRPAIVEFEAYNAMLPEVGRNKKANELAIFSIQVPLIIKNEMAKFKLDQIKNNPGISPIQLNNETHQYGEQIKDQVYAEWKNILNDALKISQEDNSQKWWQKNFGQKNQTPAQNNTQGGEESLEDIWK